MSLEELGNLAAKTEEEIQQQSYVVKIAKFSFFGKASNLEKKMEILAQSEKKLKLLNEIFEKKINHSIEVSLRRQSYTSFYHNVLDSQPIVNATFQTAGTRSFTGDHLNNEFVAMAEDIDEFLNSEYATQLSDNAMGE